MTKCKFCGGNSDGPHNCLPESDVQLGLQWIETSLPPPFEEEEDNDNEV